MPRAYAAKYAQEAHLCPSTSIVLGEKTVNGSQTRIGKKDLGTYVEISLAAKSRQKHGRFDV